MDHILKITRPDDYKMSEGCRFDVVFEKSRRLFGPDLETFEARLVAENGRTVFEVVESRQQRARQMRDDGDSYREIADHLDVGKSTIERWLKP